MEQKNISLTDKKQLQIFMNPTRQTLLREMARVGKPVTPKYLADRMGISPSSVQFHIGKLMELALIELDHTEKIRGITARYYRAAKADVSIGIAQDDFAEEREALMQQALMEVYKGFLENVKKHGKDMKEAGTYGDILTGTVYLTDGEAKELFQKIIEYLGAHRERKENTFPWELGTVAYKMEERE